MLAVATTSTRTLCMWNTKDYYVDDGLYYVKYNKAKEYRLARLRQFTFSHTSDQ